MTDKRIEELLLRGAHAQSKARELRKLAKLNVQYAAIRDSFLELVDEAVLELLREYRNVLTLRLERPKKGWSESAFLLISRGTTVIKMPVRRLIELDQALTQKVRKQMNPKIHIVPASAGRNVGLYWRIDEGSYTYGAPSAMDLSLYEVGEGKELFIEALELRIKQERALVQSYLAFFATPPTYALDENGDGTLTHNGKTLQVRDGHITVNIESEIQMPIIEDSSWVFTNTIGGLPVEEVMADAALTRLVEFNALNNRSQLADAIKSVISEGQMTMVDAALWILFDWSVKLFQLRDPEASGKMSELRLRLVQRIEAQGGVPSHDYKTGYFPKPADQMTGMRMWFYHMPFNQKRQLTGLPCEPVELQIELEKRGPLTNKNALGWNLLLADLRSELAEMVGFDEFDLWVERFLKSK